MACPGGFRQTIVTLGDVPLIFVPVPMLENSSMFGRSDLAGAPQ